MNKYFDQSKLDEYIPYLMELATNVLLAFLILIVGIYLANKANKLICVDLHPNGATHLRLNGAT